MRSSTTRLATLLLLVAALPVTPSAHAALPGEARPAMLGQLPYYESDKHQLTDRLSASVNYGSGNLHLQATEISINGTGLNLGIVRHFNSRSDERGSFGRGWTLGTGSDVRLAKQDDGDVVFHGPSGYEVTFTDPDTGGKYVTPDNFNYADLTRESNGEYLLKWRKSEETLRFNPDGVLVANADRDGNTVKFNYAAGVLTSIVDTQNRTLAIDYDACAPGYGTGDTNHCHAGPGVNDLLRNEIGTIRDWTGRETHHQYDAAGDLVSYTDATGVTYYFEYTDDGQLIRLIDPLHIETLFTYDALGRVLTLTRAANTKAAATTRYQYREDETLVTDPIGHTWTYEIDEQGRVTKRIDPLGHSREKTFDAKFNVTEIKDSLSGITKLTYDNNGNLQKIQAPGSEGGEGPSTSFDFNDSAHPHAPTSQVDPQKNTTSYSYTNAGSLETVTAADGATAKNAYQGEDGVTCGAKKGQLCWTEDPKGNKTFNDFDAAGNLIRIRPPASLGATTITPDALSRSAVIVDGKGQRASYSFDGNDRITEIRYGDSTVCQPQHGTCIQSGYDAAGNLLWRRDITGTTRFTYDGQQRPLRKLLPTNEVTELTYDRAGNVTSYTDPAGTVTYTHDAANNLATLAEPGGTCAGPTPRKCTTFRHDQNGRRTGITFPNGVEFTAAYDDGGRQESLTVKRGPSTLFKRDYTYQLNGAETALRQTMTDEAGNKTTYTYGPRNDMKKAVTTNSAGDVISSLAWEVDENLNRTSGPEGTHTYNAANQVIDAGWTHDANGNVLTGNGRTFTHNILNQTSSISRGSTTLNMTYADVNSDERVQAGATSFLTGQLGLTRQWSPKTTLSFVRDPDGNLIAMNVGDKSHYYVLDALGSVIGLTDIKGNVSAKYNYKPFGETTASGPMALVNPFRFAGGYHDDATGLTKFGTRYYDAVMGRWTQRDPKSHSIADPAQSNRYVYVGNDPVNISDPTGEDFLSNVECGMPFLIGELSAAGGITLAVEIGLISSPVGWLLGGAVTLYYFYAAAYAC